ncbi:MAG: serine O-acetyltransferase EpsC [Methylocella sp.]
MDYRLRENDKDALAQSQWDLHRIVLQLRTLRGEWRQNTKPDGVTYELPSQEALSDVLEGLSAVLFPRHFGPPSLTEEGVDYYIGRTLDGALQSLLEQVRRELKLASGLPDNGGAPREERAIKITRDFAANLPRVRALLESDILAAFQGDPAAQSIDEVLFCYPGIVAIISHRLAHELYELGAPLLARIIAEIAHSDTGIDIHPGAKIGGSFFIDHGTGVVIGETAVIGQNVRLYQGVTLGAKRFAVDDNGALFKGGARHPIIEDDVVIYAGATILGRITIGRGSTIGGNVWLTRGVPPKSNITQAQARSDIFVDGGGI